MSESTIYRDIAQEYFPGEGRSQGFAFAVGLFYGLIASNYVADAEGLSVQDTFEQKVKDLYSGNISDINSAVVFNVRTALSVFQHTFVALYTLRTQPFSIRNIGVTLADSLTNVTEQFTDEEKTIFAQHREAILKVCEELQEKFTVTETPAEV
jgi:hypothetical protein